MSSPLEHPVETLPGVGKVSGAALRERGYGTVGQLLWHLPRRYDDQRRVTPISELVPGERQVTEGIIHATRFSGFGRSRRLEVFLEPLEGEPPGRYGQLRLVWFRARTSMEKAFVRGQLWRAAGRVDERRGVLSIAHPEKVTVEGDAPGIVPRYPEIPGVKSVALEKAMKATVSRAADFVVDALPPEELRAEGWGPLGEALRALHRPPEELDALALSGWSEGRSEHHRRLAFEELFVLELGLSQLRKESRRELSLPLPAVASSAAKAEAALPFALTAAQARVVGEVRADLVMESPMRRLLQGDVGSGKTAVAMLTAAHAVAAGAQAAFLAPTELLAEQQHQSFVALAAPLGLRVGLLLGSDKAGPRRALLASLASGELDVLVGTHALLGEGVRFARLGVVVVDEQHRFGVAQRLQLVDKGAVGKVPHLLVMTATPIPRSLALVLYGDLSVSVLDELPPGRVDPTTRLYPENRRGEARQQLDRALEAGGRVYVVCPAVEGDETLRGVVEVEEELAARYGEARVGMVHGRLSTPARREVMAAFAEGAIDVLVSTTVVEVGVDVPQANAILIEQAERFGLAQLHQLRGRVGRGGQRSACLLVHGRELTPDAEERLRVMAETCDGFVVAERDLAIRGAGQIFGMRQSGASGLAFGDLVRDLPLLERARALAAELIEDDPGLEMEAHRGARGAIAALWTRAGEGAVKEEAG